MLFFLVSSCGCCEGSSYYNVVLKEIWVQGQPLAVEPHTFDGRYGTILDSGTTFAYLPEHAFHVFKDAVSIYTFLGASTLNFYEIF